MPLVPGWKDVKKGFMGKPLFVLDIKVVDDQSDPVEPGAPGQVAFKPKPPLLIIKVYFNKPDMKAKALIDDWYYREDIILQDENGVYCFVGRFGGFIRSRGENMSSHLVKGLINEHLAINASTVFPTDVAKKSEENNATV
jgi:acyl-coenzyme A synthetase/AMP-(fatty) acid ligase